MLEANAAAVLDFWFAPPGHPEHNTARGVWFKKDDTFDAEIGRRFGALIDEALTGAIDHWATTPEGALARIIVLDQFTRNVYRGTPKAFAGDARALEAARALVAGGTDLKLPVIYRQFAYLPFEHAEDLAAQDVSMRLFAALAKADPAAFAGLPTWAERHRAIIVRFGRFPHRNAILGRASTPAEEEFLSEPGSSF